MINDFNNLTIDNGEKCFFKLLITFTIYLVNSYNIHIENLKPKVLTANMKSNSVHWNFWHNFKPDFKLK